MSPWVVLFHYGAYQPLWQQPGLLQCGPRLEPGPHALPVAAPTVEAIHAALRSRGLWSSSGVLIQYTDPFLIRAAALRGLKRWRGPRLLVCGDLHHGPAPVDTLVAYQEQEPHHAVALAFNPMLLPEVQRRLRVPVHCHPPGFFRYPRCPRHQAPARRLVHVGSLGAHHPQRRALVEALLQRGRIPFEHITTSSAQQAATVYAANALVLNVPLNNDFNHRFFEAAAAGAPQVVFASPALLGPLLPWAQGRPDWFWTEHLEDLEGLVLRLLEDPALEQLPVPPPPQPKLLDWLKCCLAPLPSHRLAVRGVN